MKYFVDIPPPEQLIKGRVYKIRSRNLGHGVWDGVSEFIGIREKFGQHYLAGEIHWNLSEIHGTVSGAEDTGIQVPDGIEVTPYGSDVDQNGRAIYKDESLENPMGWSWPGWYRYTDTNEVCPKYKEDGFRYYGTQNKPLFEFLKQFEDMEKWIRVEKLWKERNGDPG